MQKNDLKNDDPRKCWYNHTDIIVKMVRGQKKLNVETGKPSADSGESRGRGRSRGRGKKEKAVANCAAVVSELLLADEISGADADADAFRCY